MRIALLVVLAVVGPGCLVDGEILDSEEPELENALTVLSNGSALNGVALNGRYLNGRYLNGVALNGRYLNGRYLNGASLGGSRLKGVWLDGSELRGTLGETRLRATDFIGVELEGVLDNGTVAKLRIDDIRGVTETKDFWSYTVSILDGSTWVPACGTTASGVPNEAIAVSGLWDFRQNTRDGGGDHIDEPDAVTLACRGVGAIAKCVEIGYRPWETYYSCERCTGWQCRTAYVCGEKSVQRLHQACTRMVRADFCGDGTPHTVDGTLIEFRDVAGIHDASIVRLEAAWGPEGAADIGAVVRSPDSITCRQLPSTTVLLEQNVPGASGSE